jgi:phage gp46-like protein
MTDLKLKNATPLDLAIENNDLAVDDGLNTAVMLSLFLDARAEDDDILPDGKTDRRGWWGDEFSEVPGDRWGSRLWLLERMKPTPENFNLAEEFARESLAWMVRDAVAAAVDAEVTFDEGQFLLSVSIERPEGGENVNFRYGLNWERKDDAIQ